LNNIIKYLRFSRLKINLFFSGFTFSQDTYLLFLGAITGILGGLGAIVFHYGIHYVKTLFFDLPANALFGQSTLIGNDSGVSIAILIAIPTIGGLFVGLISKFLEKEKKFDSIPSVIDAVASSGGVIKGKVAVKNIILSALSIGTGGAGGKEGPIVQIGSSIGSKFGQILSLSPEKLKILVGCGAASGLAASFNVPLGGALFAMEIILRTYNARSFSPVIIASVFGSIISRSCLGTEPAFLIPHFELVSNYEFIFYIVFGVLAGFGAIYFVTIFNKIEKFFGSFNTKPKYLKPALGGLLVGLIGIILPEIYGFSYTNLDRFIYGNAPLLTLLLLFVLKPIATGFTLGSGGNGGTFAPSLFTGAMLGGLFGQIMMIFFPGVSAPPGAYALVGMAALTAGTTHAPLTALVMVFEMTNNYSVILPLMITIIISNFISKYILKGSLYTLKFKEEGREIDLYGRRTEILNRLKISELIDKNITFVDIDYSFNQVTVALKESQYDSVLVRNNSEKIVGIITFQDIRNAVLDRETRNIINSNLLVAGDIMNSSLTFTDESISCEEALKKLESVDFELLPVIEKNTGTFLGVITKEKIMHRYQKELLIYQDENIPTN
jgi:chloride channel protein, CIC family